MDSKAINKLIRSEVWPILRKLGFSCFEDRSAFAYNGEFINVVHFQSFNSYNADVLGCTTYSFTVRLGVYVAGSLGRQYVKADKDGRLLPVEPQCSFRTELRKRIAVDGFDRDDIFYIDAAGRTTAACFKEVQYLLTDKAEQWFRAHNNLEDLLKRMKDAEVYRAGSESVSSARPGSFLWEAEKRSTGGVTAPHLDTSNPGSYNWNCLQSVLLLMKHRQQPDQESAITVLGSINAMIGNILDWSTIQSDRWREERHAYEVGELWEQVGGFRPIPQHDQSSIIRSGCLDGSVWRSRKTQHEHAGAIPNLIPTVSARKQLWPMLKGAGFSEFTDRLAHRVSKDVIEVVQFLPMDPFERKEQNLPAGLFRVGLGVFWPVLGNEQLCRKNAKKEQRPIVNECHVSNWLVPEVQAEVRAGTAFNSIENALASLRGPGLAWLDILRNPGSALAFLQRHNWELFWCYPMMRGYGASLSSRRFMYLAFLKHLLGEKAETQEYMRRAETALPGWYNEHYGSIQKRWMETVKLRLSEVEAR